MNYTHIAKALALGGLLLSLWTPAAAYAKAPAVKHVSVQTPSSRSVDAEPMLRTARLSFKSLGVARPIALRGVEDEVGLSFGLRLDEVVTHARLHLSFMLSPALLPGLSHLKIHLNDEVIQTIVLDKDKLGSTQALDIPVDPRYFVDYNRLRFEFIGHYTPECEMPHHSSLWASISNESYLELSLRQVAFAADLGLLPAPFFDPRDSRALVLPFVFPAHASQGLLKASGSIASWLGALAAYRGSRFPVMDNQLPAGHAVVLASNAQRPSFLKDVAAVDKPTLSLMDHPAVVGAKLLLVLGRDDAQVQLAADALALQKAALSGRSMQVSSLDYPPLRQAYEAPRWISTQRPVQFAELVQDPGQLQVRGLSLNDEITLTTHMAPDLFTWNMKGVPMNLRYRYTPTNQSGNGSLNVSINNQFIKSFPLQSSDSGGTAFNGHVLLPLFEDGTFQPSSDVKIPSFLIGGDNQLQFAFNIPATDYGRCSAAQPAELRASLDPQSTLDLSAFYHYVAMPNLSAYANSGFPFTKFDDLAQTSIVLPDQANATDIELYLTAVGRMGASTGRAGTRFKLLWSSQLSSAKDSDILIIAHADAENGLKAWGRDLPAQLEAGKRSLRPLGRALDTVLDLFTLQPEPGFVTPAGKTVLEGSGPLAAIAGFESPLSEGRSVVTLVATDSATLGRLAEVLNDPGKVRQLRGDLGLLRGNSIESFRTGPLYYVGDLPWWRRLWFHLHTHPIILAMLGLASGLVLTFMSYAALRARARRRLNNSLEL